MNWRQAADHVWAELAVLVDDPGYVQVKREVRAALATMPGYRAPSASETAAAAARERAADSAAMVSQADAARMQREDAAAEDARARANAARDYDAAKRRAQARAAEDHAQGLGAAGDPDQPPQTGPTWQAARRLRARLDAAIARARELQRSGVSAPARASAGAAAEGLQRLGDVLTEGARVLAAGMSSSLASAADAAAAPIRAVGAGLGLGLLAGLGLVLLALRR